MALKRFALSMIDSAVPDSSTTSRNAHAGIKSVHQKLHSLGGFSLVQPRWVPDKVNTPYGGYSSHRATSTSGR